MKSICALLLAIFCFKVGYSQSGNIGPSNDPNNYYTIVSPDAASLSRYGNTPVTMESGVPNISIPIYEINVSGFKLPISLSYNAGGIKVEDIGSSVGAGWVLSAGGAVNRMKRGKRDEIMLDRYDEMKPVYDRIEDKSIPFADKDADYTMAGFTWWDNNNPANPAYDMESDIFIYSTGTGSGKFFLDFDGVAHEMPASKNIITTEERIATPSNKQYFRRWIITTTDGVKYVFGRSLDDTNDTYEMTRATGDCGDSGEENLEVNTWYLAEIILTNGRTIKFNYASFSYCTTSFSSDGLSSQRSSVTYVVGRKLSEIVFDNGKVVFEQGGCRKDIGKDTYLKYIKVYNLINGIYSLIKQVELRTNNDNVSAPCTSTSLIDYQFRLRLDQILEYGSNTTDPPKKYAFEYYLGTDFPEDALGLPSRDSRGSGYFAQDLWGYYNGKVSNTSVLPHWMRKLNELIDIDYQYHDAGSDRSIDPEFAKIGTLRKITYPTGGSSTFEYESHMVGPPQPSRTNTENSEVIHTFNELDLFTNFPSKEIQNAISVEPEFYANHSALDDYSNTFTIPSNGQQTMVNFQISFSGNAALCPSDGTHLGCIDVTLEQQNEQGQWIQSGGIYNNYNIQLLPGTYRIHTEWSNGLNSANYYRVIATGTWTEVVPAYSTRPFAGAYAGGLRIKNIFDYDPETGQTYTTNYDYTFGSDDEHAGSSSGIVLQHPMSQGTFIKIGSAIANVLTYGSPSLSSGGLGIYSLDAHVHYGKVTVTRKSNNNTGGKTECYFTDAYDYPDGGLEKTHIFSYAPSTSYFWKRGLLRKQIDSKFENGTFTSVHELVNDYKFNTSPTDPNRIELINRKPFYRNKVLNYLTTGIPPPGSPDALPRVPGWKTDFFNEPFNKYTTCTESFYLSKTTEKIQDVTTTSTFEQDTASLQNSSSERQQSNGNTEKTLSTYSFDYNTSVTTPSPEVSGIRRLQDMNIIAPIEQYSIIDKSGLQYVVGGVVKVYGQSNGLLLREYILETDKPINFADFKVSNIKSDGTFEIDPHYKLKTTFEEYDQYHNLLQFRTSNGIVTSLIWGYHNNYPVAKIVGADYTSAISKLAISVEQLQNIYNDVDMRNQLNHIRQGFVANKNIQIFTSTYSPLVGITSQTDINGKTSFFEYDNEGRMKLVRDNDNNIQKVFKYHYRY